MIAVYSHGACSGVGEVVGLDPNGDGFLFHDRTGRSTPVERLLVERDEAGLGVERLADGGEEGLLGEQVGGAEQRPEGHHVLHHRPPELVGDAGAGHADG